MKRTFTVTVEGEDAHKRWFDADTIKDHVEGWTDTVVTVTETTAVHAKEKQIIDECLLMARFDANGRGYDSRVSNSRVCTLARELRALMEGKA